MTFNHVDQSWHTPDEEVKRINVNGKRLYAVNGERFYSITTILSKYKGDGIKQWRKRIGVKKAQEITSRAANAGTRLHRICEHYLMNEDIDPLILNPYNREMFQTIRPSIDQHITNIRLQEKHLYSKTLKIAGAVDLIADWDGKLSIIDFKTSINPKRPEWVRDYYLQATAYACMFYEMTGDAPKQIVLPMLVTNTMEMQIWKSKPAKWIRPLNVMVKDFYERYAD